MADKVTAYLETMNWNYLPDFKTVQIATKRYGAMNANDIVGASDPSNYLAGVESSPLILANREQLQSLMKAAGIDGTQVQVWSLRIHKTPHTKNGTPVTELPDIKISDWVVLNSKNYPVVWVDTTHRFGFGDILLVYLKEDKDL